MKTSMKIMTIIRIPIKIHFTFLIILALFAWVFSFNSIEIFGLVIGFGGTGYIWPVKAVLGVGLGVFLFVCVLLHELAHSYVSQRTGTKVNAITLFVFGGVSQAEEMPKKPALEFKIAVVGPLTSMGLGALFYGVSLLVPRAGHLGELIWLNAGALAFYNVLLGLFNLLPAFPMDGGRVLRSVLSRRLGRGKATRAAANVGKGMAVLMALAGIFSLNIWLILIAIFVYMGASREEESTMVTLALDDFEVRDIMTSDVKTVNPGMTIDKLTQRMFRYRHTGFPVVKDERLVGLVSYDDVHSVNQDRRPFTCVRDIMERDVATVRPDDEASDAFKKLLRKKAGRLVVARSGRVEGILTTSDIMHVVRIREV